MFGYEKTEEILVRLQFFKASCPFKKPEYSRLGAQS